MSQIAQSEAAQGMSPADLVFSGTPVTKAVLLVLVVLSLLSWALVFFKWWEFRRVRRESRDFTRDFERAQSLEEAAALARRTAPSAFTRVFDRAVQFLSETTPALAATPDRAARLSGSQVEALRLVLDAQSDSERDALSRFIPSLAMIGSVSPLIGLLGTVLGIIEAFIGITERGSGNIAAVAPGVAQALVATAAALTVAIPAVFAYNIFAARLARINGELEGFGSELVALMVREGRI